MSTGYYQDALKKIGKLGFHQTGEDGSSDSHGHSQDSSARNSEHSSLQGSQRGAAILLLVFAYLHFGVHRIVAFEGRVAVAVSDFAVSQGEITATFVEIS